MAQLTTGCTGIIKSVKPVMKDGEHETWENPKGVTFYKFWVEIGDKKSKKPLLSPDTEPWWAKPGIAVQYTLETLPDGKYNFSEIKKPDGQEAKKEHIKEAYKDKPAFVSTYNDPVLIHRYAIVKAQGLVTWLFDEMGYEPATIEVEIENSKHLYNWLIEDISSRDTINIRVACMENAIRHINAGKKTMYKLNVETQTFEPVKVGISRLEKFMTGEDKTTSKLIRLADELMKSPLVITKESLDKKE